jgi:hypothetical protein
MQTIAGLSKIYNMFGQTISQSEFQEVSILQIKASLPESVSPLLLCIEQQKLLL